MADQESVPAITPPAVPGILDQVKSRVAGAVGNMQNTTNAVGGMVRKLYANRQTTKLQINSADAGVPEILDAAGGGVIAPQPVTPSAAVATPNMPNKTIDPLAVQRYMDQRQQEINAAKAAAAMPKPKQTSYGDPF